MSLILQPLPSHSQNQCPATGPSLWLSVHPQPILILQQPFPHPFSKGSSTPSAAVAAALARWWASALRVTQGLLIAADWEEHTVCCSNLCMSYYHHNRFHGKVGQSVRLTRERSPVRAWVEPFCFDQSGCLGARTETGAAPPFLVLLAPAAFKFSSCSWMLLNFHARSKAIVEQG